MKTGSSLPGHAKSDATGFALLRIDETRVLVPQADIRLIDLAVDLDRGDPPPQGVGWTRSGQQRHPVYCPSSELACMVGAPQERPICAVLDGAGRVFGLLCNEALLLKAQDVVRHALPSAMATPDTPFDGLALQAGKLACISSASRLLAHLLKGSDHAQPIQEAS
jgi:hypothetical protein